MKTIPLFFFAMLLCHTASAFDLPAPFNIVNEEVFDGDWSVAHGEGTPVKNVKRSNHIRGWIDIIGFREMCNIDGVDYINISPKDAAIVKRNSWHTDVDGTVVSFKSTCTVREYYGFTIATQHTSFHWKQEVCRKVCHNNKCHTECHWDNYYEYQTISTVEKSPNVFNNSIDGYNITITSYNNSVTPYTLIYIPPRWNIIKQTVTYRNATASWYNLTGLVQKNDVGTEYVQFLNKSKFVIDEDETITRRAEYFVINEAPLNWSQFDIRVYTPYIEKSDCVCNATIYNSKPSDFILWKPLIAVVGILASFLVGIFIITGKIA